MKKRNKIQKLILIYILLAILTYSMFSFYTLSFDPHFWSNEIRFYYLTANVIIWFFCTPFIDSYK